MKLFEGGILDKITNDEYEKMFQGMPADVGGDGEISGEEGEKVDTKINGRQGMNTKTKISSEKELTALNLRMLQGAFYLALIGHILATFALLMEIECKRAPRKFLKTFSIRLRSTVRRVLSRALRRLQGR